MTSETFRGSIGALADTAGVHVETIRFYQRKGLLATPPRELGKVRRYGPSDIARVRFVKAAQRLGFSLGDIVELLTLDAGTQCGTARGIAEDKLRDVRARLRDLRRMHSALQGLVADCHATHRTVKCPLIASLRAGVTPRAASSA